MKESFSKNGAHRAISLFYFLLALLAVSLMSFTSILPAGAADSAGSDEAILEETGSHEYQAYSSTEIINEASELDGETIQFSGEAIGGVMMRRGGTWINVSDGMNAIGVFDSGNDHNKIKNTGKYQRTGDVVKVTGKLNKACPTHNGELDIHADSIDVISVGGEKPENLGNLKIIVAGGLTLLASLFFILDFRRRADRK